MQRACSGQVQEVGHRVQRRTVSKFLEQESFDS